MVEGKAELVKWIQELATWTPNISEQNPFENRVTPPTLASTRRHLAKQDAKDLESGAAVSLHVKVTPSVLISSGIDLENTHRKLRANITALGQHATDEQRGRILIQSNTLRQEIDAWFAVHALYFPATVLLCAWAEQRTTTSEDTITLFLPSEI
ncbi:hypothetical protein JVT61DRAFT_12078 [Boletus reticuloceps]|uniref:Uncharacterized protein n=1 Tax=Boletus reticuloceps TaxID=495285 RepID=A0A8I2YEI7_9AGAM|nr:hypothetical protein JVT61DRAFT_12078 [Boletus reticuloceps]